MHWLRRIFGSLQRRRREAEMKAELEHDLSMRVERHLAAGLSAREARWAAEREFGNCARIEEEARETRTAWLLENFCRDVRQALRQMAKSPGITGVALLTLALGIGANTAIFSIVRGVWLRPLPIPEPDRVVIVQETNLARDVPFFSVSVPNFVDWRARSGSFAALGAVRTRAMNLVDELGEPEQVTVRQASSDYMAVMGVRLLHGRAFRAEEDRPEAAPVALLSEGLWRRRFNAEVSVLGRRITLHGQPRVIVGVLAREPGISDRDYVLTPLAADLRVEERDGHDLDVIGRLKPGVSIEQASAELSAIAADLARAYPESNAGWGVRVSPLDAILVREGTRAGLLLLLGAVGLLLLNACANLSSLQLARAAGRERELTVRAALGASKARLATQLFTESLVLAVAGGVLGVLLAYWLIDAWHSSPFAATLVRADEVSLDGGVLLFAVGASLCVGALTGVAPAWRMRRLDWHVALNAGARTIAGRHRSLRAFVVVQIALSFVLFASAGVLFRSLRNLAQAEIGFRPQQVLTLKLAPTRDEQTFYTRLIERVKAMPGVQAVGLTSGLPLERFNTSVHVVPIGPSRLAPGQSIQTEWRIVRDDTFAAMGIPLVRGRAFLPSDDRRAGKVVVVSETLARSLWGDEDPIGRQINPGGGNDDPSTVIGVVGDVRNRHPGLPAAPGFYFSGYRTLWWSMTLVVKTAGPPEALAPLVRDAVRELDPTLPVFGVRRLEEQVAESVGDERMTTQLIGAFAVLALALAALGVFGVTSFAVSERTREIGIRLALGGDTGRVLRLILWENGRLVLLGSAIGLAVTLAGAPLLATQVYEVSPRDPATLALALGMLACAAVAAAWGPARKATRVDPAVALRAE
ncbi:MAG: ABC transporter permease [Opitutae bacterium]|nr:ABC transporter permease [Opitutae bacterium]